MPKYCCLILLFLFSFSTFSFSTGDSPMPSQGKTGLFGYVDASGDFIIKPQFEQALPFTEGIARVKVKRHWRLINAKGKFLTKDTYEEIREFRNGVAVVGKEEIAGQKMVFGLVNIKGKEIVKPQYHYLTASPDQALFIVGVNLKTDEKGKIPVNFGVIKSDGSSIIPVGFQAIRDYNFKLFAVKNKQSYWQVYTSQGTAVFVGSYTDIKDFDEELATVMQNGKWGIITRNGTFAVNPSYKNINKKGRNSYELAGFKQWKVINQKKETIFTTSYENLKSIAPDLFSYQYEGKYGLLNTAAEPVCEALYDEIQLFVNDLAIVKNGLTFGVINKSGKLILPVQYQAVAIDSASSVIKAKESGKWGIFSRTGKAITPVMYDEVRIQPYALFTVCQGRQWFLLDASGHVTGEASYDAISDFKGLYTVVKKHGHSGLINIRGSWAIEPGYDSLCIINAQTALYRSDTTTGLINLYTKRIIFSAESLERINNNLFRARKEGKIGVYDYRGTAIIPLEYDYISPITKDSIFTVEKDYKRGLINLQGKTLLRTSSLYQELHVMREERVGVKINNKFGFIDRNGKLRIANRYEGIRSFSEDMVGIKIRGKWGFVDKAEELRVQPLYEEVYDFKMGIAAVKKENQWGFVNKKGRETVKPQYESIQLLPTGRYLVTKDGKKGLVTESGRELYVPKYDQVEDLGNGWILLGRNGKFGLSDIKGLDVVPVIYDHLYVDSTKNIFILGLVPPVQMFTYAQ